MNKLKKSYIVEGINLYFVRFILSFFKKRFKPKGKILVKSCDGIGDILVRSNLAQRIIDKYGHENVFFLMQSHYTSIGKLLGYNTIGYSRKERKNFFSRLKKMYELNSMGLSKYINIEFANDITVGNIFCLDCIGKIDNHWQVERNNRYYTEALEIGDIYVIDQITKMANTLIDPALTKVDLIPDLRERFEIAENEIVIAVGSTEKSRVCSPKLMSRYLKILLEKFPDREILLIGNGERQKRYAEYLVQALNDKRVRDLVDKTTIEQVFEIVAKSFLFIGFESGLYNLCYSIRKRGIILFKEKSGIFIHEVPWLDIIFPEKLNLIVEDSEYDGVGINSITEKQFEIALKKIQEYDKL